MLGVSATASACNPLRSTTAKWVLAGVKTKNKYHAPIRAAQEMKVPVTIGFPRFEKTHSAQQEHIP